VSLTFTIYICKFCILCNTTPRPSPQTFWKTNRNLFVVQYYIWLSNFTLSLRKIFSCYMKFEKERYWSNSKRDNGEYSQWRRHVRSTYDVRSRTEFSVIGHSVIKLVHCQAEVRLWKRRYHGERRWLELDSRSPGRWPPNSSIGCVDAFTWKSDGWVDDYIPGIMLFHQWILTAICPKNPRHFASNPRRDFDVQLTTLVMNVRSVVKILSARMYIFSHMYIFSFLFSELLRF